MDERAIQGRAQSKQAALLRFAEWGSKNLVKVTNPGPVVRQVSGYFGFMQSIAGRDPAAISRMFGLRQHDLLKGAMIYRLDRLPLEHEFEVRGFSTLPDGRALPEGRVTDAGGYRAGTGGLQYELVELVPATLLGRLQPGVPFDLRTIRP